MEGLDMVFWQEEEEEVQQEQSLKLLLCCNAPQNEDWLKNQLPDFDEAGRAKNITELRKVLKGNQTINLVIIMRKTGDHGVDKPEDMAKIIREHSPEAQIFIIVGKRDERGKEIVEKTEIIGCRSLTADAGSIKAADILQEVEALAETARAIFKKQTEEVKEDPLRVVIVEGAKGGCGVTTTMAVIAQMLKKSGETVNIIDNSEGCQYLMNQDLESLIAVEDAPSDGWVITDNKNLDLDCDFIKSHILVVDPSTEALSLAKTKCNEDTIIIINRAEIEILPPEIYSGEFKRAPDLIVPYRPSPYLLLEWDAIFKDWQPLLKQLLKE